MTTLQELRFDGPQVVLRNNVVKGALLPRSYAEMDRDVRVDGEAVVEGALFARSLLITGGPLTVEGAVYAQREIHVQSDCHEIVRFAKAVGTAGTVSCLPTSGGVIFGADINAAAVTLRHAFVAANVFGDDVTLEDCVVLGGVFASKSLAMTNCVVGTFHAPAVRLAQELILLLPAGFSVEPIAALPGTRVRNFALADLAALMCGTPERENTGWVRMHVDREEQRTDLVDDAGNAQVVRSYSIAAKVLTADLLDLEALQNHFLLTAGSLGGQTIRTYDLGTGADGQPVPITPESLTAFFLKLLNGQIEARELSGNLSFDDIASALGGARLAEAAEPSA